MKKIQLSGEVIGVFFIVLLLSLGVTALIESSRQFREQEQMKYLASTVSAQTYEVLSTKLSKVETLGALIIKNNGGTDGFEKVADYIIGKDRIRNVLLAPGSVVTNVYPLDGNEKLIGHDFTSIGPGDKEARSAVVNDQITIAGPFSLAQGGMGIAGRLPIRLDGKFWGIVSITLDYPEGLSGITSMEVLRAQGFGYELWRINPDTEKHQTILSTDTSVKNKPYDLAFPIFNATWHVTVYPEKPWYAHIDVWLYIIVSLLLSSVAAVDVSRLLTIRRMDKEIAESRIRELQTQMERDRLNVLLTQINSHFFYHTLNAIQALIVLEPDAAYKMTEDFSRFLRFRIDSVGIKYGLVPFKDEIRSVLAYADINSVLMGERLKMEYNLFDADFLIPVLTIQPIVENAIVHGAKPLVSGGTVRVSLRRDGSFYEVCVEDNGLGFTPSNEYAKGSISISNIRSRLEKHRGCSITVESELGKGTKVTLRYPDDLFRECE
jgi:hypothetical protein